jgi:diguanylate cyclase (GGDEF)-like protein/PAS domain S-box-containing protein
MTSPASKTDPNLAESDDKPSGLPSGLRPSLERSLLEVCARVAVARSDALDDAIHRALAVLGEQTDSDRTYVFLRSPSGDTVDNTHEWCADGVEPVIDQLQGVPFDPDRLYFARMVIAGNVVHLDDLSQLPPGTDYERELLQSQGIQSIVVVPMSVGGRLLGFVGLDSVRRQRCWTPHVIGTLRIVAETFAGALERHRFERALEESEARSRLAASVFTHAREGIAMSDVEGRILDVNEAFCRITGYSRDEAIGKNLLELKSGRVDDESYVTVWSELRTNGHFTGEVWSRRSNGERYVAYLTMSSVRGQQQEVLHHVALFSDITEQKTHAAQLEHAARHDALTGLPNRALLQERLRECMKQTAEQKKLLAVCYIDLDGFKHINDTHGHEVGDRILASIASRIGSALRSSDIVARLGGDEFVAVLMDLPDEQACHPLMDRIVGSVGEPVDVDGRIFEISASIGVAFYPQLEDVDADQLLRQADRAMVDAKLAGKNRHEIFDAERDRSLRGRNMNLDRIRRAVQDDELVLFFQPKVNMRTGEVLGAEALLRWQHPERGLQGPMSFLPAVEGHSLAIEIGEWVFEAALRQLERWLAAGIELVVSVNVSAMHLQRADFVDRLRALLARHPAVPPRLLQLEILESSAFEDIAHVSRVIAACVELGVGFALDDFGTGYSSLTYLKRLPVGVLKVDQSFVRGMLDDPEDLAILEGVLGLARAFHRTPVAEGVEEVEQGRLLLQLGCDIAQGYGIARPMPATSLDGWLREWKPDPRWVATVPVDRNDLAVIYARLQHQSWLRSLARYLRGQGDRAPALDEERSALVQWFRGEGRRRHADDPGFESLVEQLAELRIEATALGELKLRGTEVDAARVEQLEQQSTSLVERLDAMLARSSRAV